MTTKVRTMEDRVSGKMQQIGIAAILDSSIYKIFERVFAFVFMTFISLLVFEARGVLERMEKNSDRLDVIERWQIVVDQNMFTAKDGIALQAQLSQIALKLPDRYPPSEWLDNVYLRDKRDLDTHMTEVKSLLEKIDVKLITVERNLTEHILVDTK